MIVVHSYELFAVLFMIKNDHCPVVADACALNPEVGCWLEIVILKHRQPMSFNECCTASSTSKE